MQASRRISQSTEYSGHDVVVVFADIEPLKPKRLRDRLRPLDLPRDPLEASIDCGVLLNRELLDLCQRNVNASFGLLRRLTAASTPGEISSVQADHFSNQLSALIRQGDEFLTLSAHIMRRLIASATEPWVK
jgi:hypothetical protein